MATIYNKSTLCSIFCLIYCGVVIKINLCQCQCTLGIWLIDFFHQYEYVVTETHKYCGSDNFYFFLRQIQNWFDNTIIMIIKHHEIYSLNNYSIKNLVLLLWNNCSDRAE